MIGDVASGQSQTAGVHFGERNDLRGEGRSACRDRPAAIRKVDIHDQYNV